jgi:hypothetical protein
MTWSAQPGERPESDGSWDENWMQKGEGAETPIYSDDFRNCSVSIEDDDNDLLYESESIEAVDTDPDPWLEVYREGERIKLTQSEWRAAIHQFEESGWEPSENAEVYSTPGITISADEGVGMQEAGDLLWRLIDRTPMLAESIGLNIDLFISLTKFAGRGQFSVRDAADKDGS